MKRKLIDALTDVQRSGTTAETDDAGRSDPEPTPADEELVLELLADRDGHTWQGEISTAMGWSDPKTSRLLAELEDHDEITRYRVGRRKVVCLPNREPHGLRKWG